MLQIPRRVLEKLRCSICGGYLSSKPLMVKCESQQVCGKCYRILPAEEKSKCVRQIGLESLSEIITFPCRYNTQGCTHTFSWCDEKDHEVECPFRSAINIFDTGRSHQRTLNSNEVEPELHSNIVCKSDQVEAVLRCEMKSREYSNESRTLSLKVKVKGNRDNYLAVRSFRHSEMENVEVEVGGSVLIGSRPEILFMDVNVVPVIFENTYESLIKRPSERRNCANCGERRSRNMGNHCLCGHSSCNTCKGVICKECVGILEKDSKKLCRNFLRGCTSPIEQDDLHKHQTNCEYNDITCPIRPCNIIDTLSNIKVHLKQSHSHEIIQTHEFIEHFYNKDRTIIILCHGSIFKCTYYYYKTFVEFFVTYLGSSDDSDRYKMHINVLSNGNVLSGRAKCCNWNSTLLEKGIVFDKRDLLPDNDKKLMFECKIKILGK